MTPGSRPANPTGEPRAAGTPSCTAADTVRRTIRLRSPDAITVTRRRSRPSGGGVTMQCKERIEAYLRENGIPFQVQFHPVAYTAQHVADAEHISGKLLAKVVM